MRRNNRNIPRGSGGGSLNMAGPPFITDHLKDIDLELDLLKRKREMLEQQQMFQPIIQQQQPQRSFSQQPFYLLEPKQSGSNRDFSHLYNDGSQQFRKPPYAKKRQSESDWQHSSNPKRSTGSGQRGSSYGGSTPARRQRPPRQSHSYEQNKPSIGQRIGNQKPQRPERSFTDNKVSKPSRAYEPPNKMASQPVANRNKLVATAIRSVAEVQSQDMEALRLLADKVPTKQMTGRLELALGVILRDVRAKCEQSSHCDILRSTTLQRVIKQAIRERVRTAMLGKVVGATPETIKAYRAMYPTNTDIEIVNIALEAGGIKPEKEITKPIIVVDRERAEDYFKTNMSKLIDTHLQEMFDKMEEIYNGAAKDEIIQPTTQNSKTETITEANAQDGETAPVDVAVANNESTTEVNESATEVNESATEVQKSATEVNESATEVNASAIEGNESAKEVNESATEVNKSATEVNEAATEVNEAAKEVNESAMEVNESATGENEQVANVENPEGTNIEKVEDTNNEKIETADVDTVNAKTTLSINKIEELPYANEYKRLLPRLLKRHIPTILKLMNLNRTFKRVAAEIETKTKSDFVQYVNAKPDRVVQYGGGKSDTASTNVKPNSEPENQNKFTPQPYVVFPYYVKVMGKPQLPKKKLMHTFLEVFNPKSIKKHRNIHNLLFIGFSEKSDFDAIVQADGSVIGRNTLSIRVCDKNQAKPDSKDNDEDKSEYQNNDESQDANMDVSGGTGDNAQDEIPPNKEDGDTSMDNVDEVLQNIKDLAEEIEQIYDNDDKFANNANTANNTENIENINNGTDAENLENKIEDAENKTENAENKIENAESNTDNVQNKTESQPNENISAEKADQVSELKNTGQANKATPTRASARRGTTTLGTPSNIGTRRSSRNVPN